jgi:ElaB/YqjD/DUF883 family membrane-anchored ribosome-binding protein
MSDTDRLERDLEQDREHLRETLGAIEQKMSPGRLLDEAMAYFGTGPKAIASDLGTQVRDNPMPVLLTGVGLAWLIMSDRKSKSSRDTSAGASASAPEAPHTDGFGYVMDPSDYDAWQEHDRLQQAEWACVRQDGETADAYGLRLDQARAAALGVAYEPADDHAGFSSKVRSAADAVKSRGAAARDKLKSASRGAGNAATRGGQAVKSAAATTKQGVANAAAAGMQLHETNPIATAAIGVAIGALVGAAIPLSRKEEQVLGKVADAGLDLGAQASRKAADALTERTSPSGGAQDGSSAAGSSLPMGAI